MTARLSSCLAPATNPRAFLFTKRVLGPRLQGNLLRTTWRMTSPFRMRSTTTFLKCKRITLHLCLQCKPRRIYLSSGSRYNEVTSYQLVSNSTRWSKCCQLEHRNFLKDLLILMQTSKKVYTGAYQAAQTRTRTTRNRMGAILSCKEIHLLLGHNFPELWKKFLLQVQLTNGRNISHRHRYRSQGTQERQIVLSTK